MSSTHMKMSSQNAENEGNGDRKLRKNNIRVF